MRKISIPFIILFYLLFSNAVRAQQPFHYWFGASSGTYSSLTGATVVTSTTPWDSTSNFSVPIGFSINIDGTVTDHVYLHRVHAFCVDTFTIPILHGFQLINAALIDRGSGSSSSPISYTVSGTPGSQIFKLEIKNAGFIEELIIHSTLNDYTNIQLWLYEGTNVVEIHYGPSQITNPSEYFTNSGGDPIVGYSWRKNLTGSGTLYSVDGPASNPALLAVDDSMVFSSYAITHVPEGLLGYPPSGTIFKYTPIRAGVSNVNIESAHIYPTVCKTEIMVDYTNMEPTTFEVISMKGMPTVMKGILQNGTTHIDLSRVAAGNYLLSLQNSSGKFVQKFIKL